MCQKEIRNSLLKQGFVTSGLFCFTFVAGEMFQMGFISLRIKLSTSSGPVAKNESDQFNQNMKNDREKMVAIREQEHAEPWHHLFFLLILYCIGPCHDWLIFSKDVSLFLCGIFRCDEPVGICWNRPWLMALGDVESRENITLTQEWLTAQS